MRLGITREPSRLLESALLGASAGKLGQYTQGGSDHQIGQLPGDALRHPIDRIIRPAFDHFQILQPLLIPQPLRFGTLRPL